MKPAILLAHQWNARRGLYGADRVFLRLLKKLEPSFELLVAIESGGELADAARAVPSKVFVRGMGVLRRRHMHPLGMVGRIWETWTGAVWLRKIIRDHDVKVVVTSTISVVAASLAARATGRPHIWFIQETLKGYTRLLAPVVRACSDKVVAVSAASAETIERRHTKSGRKICVLYPGVYPERFEAAEGAAVRKEFERGGRKVFIGLVARLHFWKGHEFLLNALADLKARGVTNFRGFFVGDVYPGYEDFKEHLRRRVKELGLETDVIFYGQVDDAAEVFAALDIAVQPSTHPEPYGLALSEAMASGCAVIGTAWGGLTEVIEDGVSGFLIPPGDVRAFSDRLQQLIENQEMRERMGKAANARVNGHFHAADFDENFRRIIADFVRSNDGNRR